MDADAATAGGWRSPRPSAPVDDAFRNYLTGFGALWLLVVAAGIGFAVLKGRRIAGALESLEARAAHLAAGRPLTGLAASQVQEVDHALAALGQASAALEAATQQRNAALEVEREAREAAEAGSRAKDEFLAMLGHELRNPLAAITNAASIVIEPPQHARADRVRRQTWSSARAST